MFASFVTSNILFALFLMLFIAIFLGSLSFRGISLGMAAVLFVSLVFGYFGLSIPQDLTNLGLALFAYSIGLQVGPGFFKAFKENGKRLVLLCSVGTFISAFATLLVARYFHILPDVAAGLFAGSNTNTPVLASATEFASKLNFLPSNISVGYGISYPISAIVVLLTVQLAPVFFKQKAAHAEETWLGKQNRQPLLIKHFRIINPACFGKKITEFYSHDLGKVNISRIRRDNKYIPATANRVFEENDIVTVVGLADPVERIGLIFGREEHVDIKRDEYAVMNADINVFSSAFIGKTLKQLRVWEEYNVVVTRVKKNGYELVPSGSYEFENGDVVHAVGKREDISRFTTRVSTVDEKTNEVNYLSFFLGLSIGILIGLVPITLFGTQITLGMSTGVFLVSLIIGYRGKIGKFKIYVPQAASNLTRDLGLMLFMAGAGTAAGRSIVHIFQIQGMPIIYATLIITLFSTIVPFLLMLLFIKADFYTVVGAFTGFAASPSALVTAKNRININIAMLAYAASYPFTLIFKVIVVQLMMILLQYTSIVR